MGWWVRVWGELAGQTQPCRQHSNTASLSVCWFLLAPVELGEVRGEHFCEMQSWSEDVYKRRVRSEDWSVGACNPRSPESQRILEMKAALVAGLVAGVLADGHGGDGSHQSQYGGGGGGGQTAYSSYARGAQDAFNQLGETIPGTPGEDYPILAEVGLL